MNQELKFFLITDTHYYAYEKLGYSDDKDQKCMNESGAIIDAVFEKFLQEDEIDIILIAGDLTNNGEVDSHKGFIERLNRLKEAGKKVYVITATHDYGLREISDGESVGKDDGKVLRSDLRDLYLDFGFSSAIAEHKSLSYVAQLAPGFRLLALNDDGDGRSFCGYDQDQLDWILNQIKEAQDAGDFIFAMTHHPMLPPTPMYPLISERDMLGNYKEVAKILADAGLQIIFTGHTHIVNIGSMVTDKGNEIWDVNTGSLVGYPTPIRRVEINNSQMQITTERIEDFEWDRKGMGAQEYLAAHFDSYLGDLFDSMANDFERFTQLAVGFSLEREKAEKFKIPIKFTGKILQKLTLGHLSKLLFVSRKVDKSVKDILLKDLILEIVRNIFSGNEHYSPDTPMHQALILMIGRLSKLVPGLKKKGYPLDDLPDFVSSLIYDPTPDHEALIPLK
ncbi:MAG: metallophosphoesterase [Clostridiales bacterium]|nr:metallophosphoesterase [Clostridiales bacterium]